MKERIAMSLLYDGASRHLAPGYDLVSTVFWPALATAPAMKIGGSDSINSIFSGHWRKFADELSISATALYARLKVLLRGVLGSTCGALALPDECNAVLDTIKSRAAKLNDTVS
jgi:hypothetical protein